MAGWEGTLTLVLITNLNIQRKQNSWLIFILTVF